MGLSILNNIPSLEAQNQLSITNSKLQNTLFQLSSGSKINSGADDPAGLSIANGLQANITALTQSAQNVTDGVGLLQTADGALSQVTTLLNRAVTLATEAGNAGLTVDQQTALQNEFNSITSEINQIGTNTTYNDGQVFTGQNMSVFLSDGSATDQTSTSGPTIAVAMPSLSAAALDLNFGSFATGTIDLMANPQAGNTVTIGTQTYTFEAAGSATAADEVALGTSANATLLNLQMAVNGLPGAGDATYGVGTSPNASAQITSVNGGSATVQALQAGTAGNSIPLSAVLTAGAGGVVAPLTGGAAVVAPKGTLLLPAQPTAGDTLTIGSTTYTFVASGDATTGSEVALGASINATLQNLEGAVNTGGAGAGGTYYTSSGANSAATITNVNNNVATVTATVSSSATAAPTVTFTATGSIAGDVSGAGTLAGGANAVAASAQVQLNSTPSVGNTLTLAGETYTFVAAGGATAANEVALGTGTSASQILLNTMINLEEAVDGTGTPGVNTYGVNTGTNTNVEIPASGSGSPAVNGSGVGTFTVEAITPGTTGNSLSIIANLTNGVGGVVGAGMSGGGGTESLMSATNAQAALVTIESAISTVAGDRGAIGAGINQMNAALDVMNNTAQNLTSSMSSIEDANIGQVISNMSKYQVLEQTGIAALAQSNTSEQAILRLLP
jgi:flagellin